MDITDFEWDEGFKPSTEEVEQEIIATPNERTPKTVDKTEDKLDEEAAEFDKLLNSSQSSTEGQESTNNESNIVGLTDELKTFFTVDIEEGDDLEILFEKQREADLNDGIEQLVNGIKQDRQASALIKHLRSGGTVDDFLNSVHALNTNAESEDSKINTLIQYYKGKGIDSDEANDMVQTIKNNGKLDTKYETVKAEIEKEQAKLQTESTKQIEQNKLAAIKLHKERQKNLSDVIKDRTFDFNGLGKTNKDEAVVDFLLNVDNTGRTKFQQKVSELFALENSKQLLTLAKLLKDGFDFSAIEAKGAKKEVKNIKSNLQHETKQVKGSSIPLTKGSLADMFT